LTPSQIRTAYGLNSLPLAADGTPLDGSGQTIAIVDAYYDPTIFSDLDAFDSQFGLTSSSPTLYQQYGAASSFLTVLNQSGQQAPLPSTDPGDPNTSPPSLPGGWEGEEALDVEWAHAIAPGAKIDLIECADGYGPQGIADLMAGATMAGSLPGVSVVSMSWGFTEGTSPYQVTPEDEAMYDADLTSPGVTYLAGTGDFGVAGTTYPA
jgi:subtilase family serine protease